MKKKYILLAIIVIIIISSIFFINNKNKNVENEDNTIKQSIDEINETSTLNSIDEQKIEEIQKDLGYNNIDSQMYEIKQEYDGREVITIKPTIQYKVAMAGVIKNGKPEFSELDKLLEQAPKKSGIWIAKNSREKILNILKDVTNGQYVVDNDGYLNIKSEENLNEIDLKIKNTINGKKLYAIDINKITYIVDEVTGAIEEYPFEEMDPYLPYELFETENATLYVITPNTYKKLNVENIIEEIINNIKE